MALRYTVRTHLLRLLNSYVKAVIRQITPAAGGVMYCLYDMHKCTHYNGKLVSVLVDPIIGTEAHARDGYQVFVIGSAKGDEQVISAPIPRTASVVEIVLSLPYLLLLSWDDVVFLCSFFNEDGVRPDHPWVHFIKVVLISNLMSAKFVAAAERFDQARVVVFYNSMMLGVVRAFRLAHKPVWDIQHGLLGETHFAYGPRAARFRDANFSPTGQYTWDDDTRAYVERVLQRTAVSLDYLHLKYWKAADRAIGSPFVFYSLQWDTPFPEQIFQLLDEHPQVAWVFRKHPMAWKIPAVDRLKDYANVTVTDGRAPLIADLDGARLHVTFNSSVVHECAVMGIPSVILDPSMAPAFSKEREANRLEVVQPDALRAWFGRWLQRCSA